MQYFGKEVRKQQTFAAGKSHAAAGLRIVVTVLLDFPHQPFERILLPAQRERLIWADLGAPAAEQAIFAQIYMRAVPHDMPLGTDRNAPAAANAPAFVIHHFRREGLALRVVAPSAGQVTALKIYNSAHARSVVHGTPRYIDQPRGHIV